MSFRFAFIAVGIFSLFCLYSILQERLLKGVYGEEKEKFTFVLPLLFVNTIFNCGYAFLIKYVKRTIEDNKIPTSDIALISFHYLLAMITSIMAIQWVSYPAQVIAKSAKPIPVLIMGVLIGICLFFYRDDKSTVKECEGFNYGEVLLVMALLFDGMTNALEERIMSKCKPTSNQLMLEMNKWSMILIGIFIFVTGEIFEFFAFIHRHPSSIVQINLISLCGAFGQFFIFLCLTEFGTLTCSVITTTRKFFTVLGSVIIFKHVLQARQWLGVVLVFSGLIIDAYFSSIG